MLRLRTTADFERVRRDGRSYAHPLLVLVACRREPPDAAPVGVGFTAGRSVGTAVRRNRAKRLLREAVRALAPQLTPGWDLVLIARAPLAATGLAPARAALTHLLRKAHVLNALAA